MKENKSLVQRKLKNLRCFHNTKRGKVRFVVIKVIRLSESFKVCYLVKLIRIPVGVPFND